MARPDKPEPNDHVARDEHTPTDTNGASHVRTVLRYPGLSTTLASWWGWSNKKPPAEGE